MEVTLPPPTHPLGRMFLISIIVNFLESGTGCFFPAMQQSGQAFLIKPSGIRLIESTKMRSEFPNYKDKQHVCNAISFLSLFNISMFNLYSTYLINLVCNYFIYLYM